MKFPFFASFIVLIIWLKYEISKSDRRKENALHEFLDAENTANSVRRQSLEHLDYVEIPYDSLPYDILPEDDTVLGAVSAVEALKDKKIVNLSGITNTELKMTYGAANITPLSEYDQNYTSLITAIYNWASVLWQNGYQKEAVPMLEFAVGTGSDISGCYRLLYDYYIEQNDMDKIRWLRERAETLNCAMKNSIIRLLWGGGQTAP